MKKKSHNMIAIHPNVKANSAQEFIIRSFSDTHCQVFRVSSTLDIKFAHRLGILKSYNQRLRNLTALLQNLDSLVRELDIPRQKDAYDQVFEIRNAMTGIYARLEAQKFFGSKETEELAEGLIEHSFGIESYIRFNALDYIRTDEDAALEKWASEISLNSALSILREDVSAR